MSVSFPNREAFAMSGMIDQLLLEAPKVHQYAQSRKGLVPQNRKSRAELIRAHLMGQIVETSAQSAIHIEAYFLPPPYPPSVSPLALLKKVMIKDLLLETHHTGSYVLLRTATGPRSTSGIHFVVEDETEDCILLSLYHQSKSQPGKITLEQGQICIVKEPYLVAMSEDGIKIRVDHLSDIISVNPFDDKVPQKWRCSKTNSTASADTWRARGKDFYKQSKYQFAIECLSNGLQCSPTDNEARSITYTRALAFLKMGIFEAALSDLEHPLVAAQAGGIYLSRKAETLYNLER